ncbi:hypothetical protein V5F38_12530 [Xanthobacter sp. V0B-10]
MVRKQGKRQFPQYLGGRVTKHFREGLVNVGGFAAPVHDHDCTPGRFRNQGEYAHLLAAANVVGDLAHEGGVKDLVAHVGARERELAPGEAAVRPLYGHIARGADDPLRAGPALGFDEAIVLAAPLQRHELRHVPPQSFRARHFPEPLGCVVEENDLVLVIYEDNGIQAPAQSQLVKILGHLVVHDVPPPAVPRCEPGGACAVQARRRGSPF